MLWNPPEAAACPTEALDDYRDVLLEHGIGLGPWKRGVAQSLCFKLTEGAQEGPPYSGNLIVSTDARVANLVAAGFFEVKGGEILALPPGRALLEPVRDAIYIEQFADFYSNKEQPWARLARDLVSEIQKRASARWLGLGARSALCHQGQVVARGGSWSLSGSESSCVCAGRRVQVRIQLPARRNVPGPSMVNVDLCVECGAGPVELRLGLAMARPKATYGRRRHEHSWRRFRLPVPDLDPGRRHFGFVTGRVCLGEVAVTTRSRKTKEPCLETTGVRIDARHVPNYTVPGAGQARPEAGLSVGPEHVHVWAVLQGPEGRDEIRCVTCDAVLARLQMQQAASERRVAANPTLLPVMGDGDETPDFLAERDSSARHREIGADA
jgi:hypothetical protein